MGCVYYRLKFTHDFSAQKFKAANNYKNFLIAVAIDAAIDAVIGSVDVVVANRCYCEFLPSAVEQLL